MQVQVLSSAPGYRKWVEGVGSSTYFLCPRQRFARVVGRSTRKDSEGVRRQGQSARHVQTRMIQVHVGNHAGSSPVIRTIFVVRKSYKTEKAQDLVSLVLFCYHFLWFAPFAEYLNLGAAFDLFFKKQDSN